MSMWSILRRSLILLAIAGCAVLLWRQIMPSEERAQTTFRQASVPELTIGSAAPTASPSESSAGRDLFVSAAPPPAPIQSPAPPKLAPALSLVGTGIGPPSFAILRSVSTGEREKVTAGSKIAGWVVMEIRKNEILVEQSGAQWAVGFPPTQPRDCAQGAC